MNGRKSDPSFYPVIYGLREEDDWNDEKNWYKANPSLGHTISIDRVRDAYRETLDNPGNEEDYLITETGARRLGKKIPLTPEEVEALR